MRPLTKSLFVYLFIFLKQCQVVVRHYRLESLCWNISGITLHPCFDRSDESETFEWVFILLSSFLMEWRQLERGKNCFLYLNIELAI